MNEIVATSSAPLTNAVGLHARPSVKLTRLAKTFEAQIEVAISPDGPWVDAKSIVKVMAFKAAKGAVLHFRASGPDAEQALAALRELVDLGFHEEADGAAAADRRDQWLRLASRAGPRRGASPPAARSDLRALDRGSSCGGAPAEEGQRLREGLAEALRQLGRPAAAG